MKTRDISFPFISLASLVNSVVSGRIFSPFFSPTSTVASILFRASPIDPALRPPSPSASQTHELPNYSQSSIDSEAASRQPLTDAAVGVSSTASHFSGALPEVGGIDSHSHSSNGFESSSLGPSLPGLSALASVASAPTSNLRYVLS